VFQRLWRSRNVASRSNAEAQPFRSTAPKSVRLQWPDGTIVAVGFTAKGEAKSAVALAHTKLRDRTASEKAKKDWADRLDALAALLVTGVR
jgi:hypothetical protein